MAGPWDDFRAGGEEAGTPWNDFRGSAKPEESADMRAGRALPSGLQGGLGALQGITLGFGDEVAGLGGAIAGGIGNLFGKDDGTSFGERYRRTRDAVRGAQAQAAEDNQILQTAAKIATGAPLAVLAPGAGVARAVPVGVGGTTLRAAGTGAAFGAAQGAGESTADALGGVALDALKGGVESAALGAGSNLAIAGIGGVGGAVRRAVSKPAAQDYAKLKVAEALARDAKAAPGGIPVMAIDDATAAISGLGPEARVADVAGESTRGLLDTMATLPGRSKTLVEDAIRARQAGRGGRLVADANEALQTNGKSFVGELEQLAEAKMRESAPLYDQVRDVPVRLTKEVKALLARVPKGAWKDTATILKAETGQDLDIGTLLKRRKIPLSMLDSLKRGLYESGQGLKAQGKRGVARPLDDVRTALIEKLDEISPKNAAGDSIYKTARETFGGFARLEELANAGRDALKNDAADIASLTRNLDPAELHSFRIGALEALKQKVGTEGGQTNLLKFWKEPKTQEQIKVIFGEDANKFFGALQREATLKRLEGVGRGSQTASRAAAMADLDMNPAAASAVRGDVRGAAVNAISQLFGRVRTPEATRDEIGRILLAQGGAGQAELNALRAYLNRVNDARSARASAAGAFAGIADF